MIQEIQIMSLSQADHYLINDVVAIEEPLEIQLLLSKKDKCKMLPLSVTMRTPGHDEELAIGFIFTEGIITSQADLQDPPTYPLGENKILVRLSECASFDPEKLKRNFYTTSSCGVCGKESIEAIHQICSKKPDEPDSPIELKYVYSLPERLRAVQKTFKQTGGIHAAAMFSLEGTLLCFREDVGRHNALDKLIGAVLFGQKKIEIELRNQLLLLSGRASFELIQKAAMAGIRIVCAIGAPSSMAVATAESFGITLIGFLKSDSANIYCRPERIKK